eukprot:CAMPEP_0170930726 /NCGR_PEP_ID=MMETSP0735-20130129/15689_1 /TAXON_ID=186038 /ORGANISM="Fragilariopsis kerguelensis, Strain L26-C5" /LENGTH=46 /DNA_ID= /DNA_START= /DNA_END= /DNA_ORIENTATION=
MASFLTDLSFCVEDEIEEEALLLLPLLLLTAEVCILSHNNYCTNNN